MKSHLEFNFLGIAFVGYDVPKKKALRVEEMMEQIIQKYRDKAIEEFDYELNRIGLESAMGVVIKKSSQ